MERLRFTSPEAYGKHVTDLDYWRPYVEMVCARHNLTPCRAIRPGMPGTNAVFIVEERYAVKLFTEFFDGPESFPSELDMYACMARAPQIPAPALVAHGTLFPDEDEWPWPYIVTRVVPGTSFGEVYERVTYADRLALARYLGPMVGQIHGLSLDGSRHLRRSWDAFVRFLEEQRRACAENNRRWRTMPDRLIAQIDGYLPPITALVDRTVAPHLLHCDLNEDHVLGRFDGERWRPTGIIDFGDAKVGDRLYDLATLHIGLFRCDKRLLRAFLESYGFDEGLRERFVLRAMSFTLLHEFDVLGQVFRTYPAACDVASLEELATLLWDLERPGLGEE